MTPRFVKYRLQYGTHYSLPDPGLGVLARERLGAVIWASARVNPTPISPWPCKVEKHD